VLPFEDSTSAIKLISENDRDFDGVRQLISSKRLPYKFVDIITTTRAPQTSWLLFFNREGYRRPVPADHHHHRGQRQTQK
jgi:hypothetical protein